jgi:tetratricopeptide (TPR) repeat protein
LASKLVSVADHSYFLHRLDIVDCIGQLLLDLPLPRQWEGAGSFYHALAVNQSWKGDTVRARRLFEEVADTASLEFRAKALLALGTGQFGRGEHQNAMALYREILLMATRDRGVDPVTAYYASRMTVKVRSIEGDHEGALCHLESLLPLARMAGSLAPHVYYDYMNSLAVELGEAGRFEQARQASAIALASPYAPEYPEWRETLDEIESKIQRASRSMVAVARVPSEIGDPPTEIMSWAGGHVRPSDSAPQRANYSASIVCFQDWKKKVEKETRDNSRRKPTTEDIRSMEFTEKQATITRFVYADDVTEEMLDSILQLTSLPNTGEGDGA